MLLFESSSIGRSDGKIAWDGDGRDGRVLVAVPLRAGAAPAGLGTGLLFGRTSGSAAFGRRILITGAPFGPVGVREFEGFVGVDILPTKQSCTSGQRQRDESHQGWKCEAYANLCLT